MTCVVYPCDTASGLKMEVKRESTYTELLQLSDDEMEAYRLIRPCIYDNIDNSVICRKKNMLI